MSVRQAAIRAAERINPLEARTSMEKVSTEYIGWNYPKTVREEACSALERIDYDIALAA